MTTYKLINWRGETSGAYREDNGFRISFPFDPANTDAQQFAKWLQDGNVPEAAEEGGTVSPEWVTETIAKLLPNG